jgi:transcriptional regulator of acetoin/glycerol metabolism
MAISPDALMRLQDTPWPGNVRELKQVLDAAVAFARGIVDVRAIDTAMLNRSTTPVLAPAVEDLAQRRELVSVLERAAWDTERAASMLGLHRATIYRRMKRHRIDVPSDRPSSS